MSSISACNAQFLPFLSLPNLSHKSPLLNPPFLVSSAANLTSSRLQHFSAPPRPLLKSRVRVSVISQDSELDGADEEETDVLGVRGGDWGQQEEVSDADEALGGDGGEGYSVPPEGAKLFVGNLPFEVDSERLAGVFNQAGVVEVAEIIYNRGTDQSRGFGFVTMSTVEEAEKAMEMFNGYDLDGRELTVNKATRRGSQPIESGSGFARNRRIFVGNLPWQLDDARLEEVFGEYGSVVEARVVYERESGRSRGFGFVRMSTDKEIDDAIASLDGKNVDGRSIRVSVAEERPRRSSY